jgi:hypothetical protein
MPSSFLLGDIDVNTWSLHCYPWESMGICMPPHGWGPQRSTFRHWFLLPTLFGLGLLSLLLTRICDQARWPKSPWWCNCLKPPSPCRSTGIPDTYMLPYLSFYMDGTHISRFEQLTMILEYFNLHFFTFAHLCSPIEFQGLRASNLTSETLQSY